MLRVQNSLQKLRLERNITQEELAEAVDVSRQTINALERGRYLPTVYLALKIAKYFKKSLEDVFFLRED